MKKTSVLLILTFLLTLNSLFGQGWVGNSNSLYSVNSTLGLTPIKVGIGISAPTALFHTNGTLRFQGLTQNNALNKILVMDNTDNIFWRDASSLTPSSNGWLLTGNAATTTDFIGTTSNQDFRIRTNNVQRLIITSTGNVGIGNNNPNALLSLGANQLNFNPFDSDPIYSTFGTSGPSTIKGLGTIVIDFDNNNNDLNQNFIITHNGGKELFRVSDNGYTGIGSNNPTHRLTLPNDASGNNGKAIAVEWATYSSKKIKENIETINNPLKIIKGLRGVEYDFKPEYGAGHSYGFIAEEVETVLPDVIAKDNTDETIGVNYQEIIPILLEAIKEQQKEINLLKIELDILKKK